MESLIRRFDTELQQSRDTRVLPLEQALPCARRAPPGPTAGRAVRAAVVCEARLV
jgi:hypothetical protein